MTEPPGLTIRIRRGDTVFHVHGNNDPLTGTEGVWLAEGQVQGIYDSPVKTTWKSSAFEVGSRQVAYKRMHRDLNLGFHIIDTSSTWEFNDGAFRSIFSYYNDPFGSQTPTTIEIETALSGTRCLDVLMYEQPEVRADLDPSMQGYSNVIMKLRAGQPDFYQAAHVSNYSGSVTVENPTDQTMYHSWVLPVGTHTLPDVEWGGDPGARTVRQSHSLTVTISSQAGGAVATPDMSQLPFRDLNGTNIMGQLRGRFLNFPVPPYTQPTELSVSGSGQLIQPRRWSRPWGGEMAGS